MFRRKRKGSKDIKSSKNLKNGIPVADLTQAEHVLSLYYWVLLEF